MRRMSHSRVTQWLQSDCLLELHISSMHHICKNKGITVFRFITPLWMLVKWSKDSKSGQEFIRGVHF